MMKTFNRIVKGYTQKQLTLDITVHNFIIKQIMFFGLSTDMLLKCIELGMQAIILILVIAILCIVAKSKEGFGVGRGVRYADGKMIYADVPEKVKIGDVEYDNPLYVDIAERWVKTEEVVDGVPVWQAK
jgi:hypothetical protein